MKRLLCRIVSLLGVLCLQLTLPVHAFTLGEVAGKLVLGRPFDVTVRVQSDAGEEVSAACVVADVLYGDAKQTQVRVSVLAASPDAAYTTLRVQASAFINEPVVTLVMRATCASTTQRSYVLLADFPTTANVGKGASALAESSVAGSVLVMQPQIPVPPQAAAMPPEVSSAAAKKAATSPKPRTWPKRATAAQTTASPAVAAAAKRAKPAPGAGKSVLKLDPLDIFSDRLDALNSPMLFEPTQDALLQARKVTALEQDVKSLRALVASNDAKVSQLRVQLQEAQAKQLPEWVVYGIGLVLLGCCTVLGWLLLKQRRQAQEKMQAEWWSELNASGSHSDELEDEPMVVAKPVVVTPAPVVEMPAPVDAACTEVSEAPSVSHNGVPSAQPELLDIDIDLDHVIPVAHFHGSFEYNTASAPFEVNSVRHISVEPILDIRQQAEFFVSLGQSDRALNILRKQIAESTEPNPLVYLDLILLFHTLGLKKDYKDCCEAFQLLFNAIIPDFPAFNVPGRGIEDYPDVVDQLVALWPRQEALVFLSACIFHDMHVQSRQTFELQAFRDLLMLHAMVEELGSDTPVVSAEVTPEAARLGSRDSGRAPVESNGPLLDIDFSAVKSTTLSTGQPR